MKIWDFQAHLGSTKFTSDSQCAVSVASKPVNVAHSFLRPKTGYIIGRTQHKNCEPLARYEVFQDGDRRVLTKYKALLSTGACGTDWVPCLWSCPFHGQRDIPINAHALSRIHGIKSVQKRRTFLSWLKCSLRKIMNYRDLEFFLKSFPAWKRWLFGPWEAILDLVRRVNITLVKLH